MKLIDWLRKLGVLRFGAEGAVYHNAAERPLSLQQDGVFDSEKDLVRFGGKSGQGASPAGKQPKGT